MHLFAIFGNPVAHSKSPLMHNSVFAQLQIPACYTRIHLQEQRLLREKFLQLALSGANITVPHKEAAYSACDEIRGFAKKAGVVNTVIYENNKLIGYNTDADGFMFAIREFSNIKNVLVLGAGGTAKALVEKFIQEQMQVTVLNRTAGRLEAFAKSNATLYTWENFQLSSYDLVVNTTSAGLSDTLFPAPEEIIDMILQSTRYVADVIYGKQTPFLAKAQRMKIPSKDGADMLLGQGVLANELFLRAIGKEASREKILKAMQKSFLL